MSETAQVTPTPETQVVTTEGLLYADKTQPQQETKAESTTEAKGEIPAEKATEPEKQSGETPVESTEKIEPELELKLTDGLSESDLQEIKEFAKENKISNEVAQKILDGRLDLKSKFVAANDAALKGAIEGWKQQSMSDPEIGGDNLQKSLELANLTITKFDKDFKGVLDKTGLGNHPMMLRLLARIGKHLQPDSMVPSKNGNPEGSRVSTADLMYPNM